MKTRKSWREKLQRIQDAQIVVIPPRMQKRFGQGKMLIPRPRDVDAVIRKVGSRFVKNSQARSVSASRARS